MNNTIKDSNPKIKDAKILMEVVGKEIDEDLNGTIVASEFNDFI